MAKVWKMSVVFLYLQNCEKKNLIYKRQLLAHIKTGGMFYRIALKSRIMHWFFALLMRICSFLFAHKMLFTSLKILCCRFFATTSETLGDIFHRLGYASRRKENLQTVSLVGVRANLFWKFAQEKASIANVSLSAGNWGRHMAETNHFSDVQKV